MRGPLNYEVDESAWTADAYRVDGYDGVAWHVLGWETEPIGVWSCQDCDASGYERDGGGGGIYDRGDADCEHAAIVWDTDSERTGSLVMVMVGDDQKFAIDPDDVTPLDREDYCGSCGQIGCRHDGYDRSAS